MSAGYLTDVLGHEAAAFITRHKAEPWLLYLAFNAPRSPLQVTEKQLDRVKHIADETRGNYGGLVVGLDDAIAGILAALKRSGQSENTLVWFLNDNGGPVTVTHSDNAPLRGAKRQPLKAVCAFFSWFTMWLLLDPRHTLEGGEGKP